MPFQDTDMAGVVHYTHILGYAELAEHALLSKIGISPISEKGGFPKVHVECDYLQPLRYGDDIQVHLSLDKLSARSLHWRFEITVEDKISASISASISAKGKLITAHVDSSGSPCEISAEWQKLLNHSLDLSVGD